MKLTIVATATVAGAFLAISGAGVAQAGTTTGYEGVLSGNQVSVPNSIPVDNCADAIVLQGVAYAGCAAAERATGVSWDGGGGGFGSEVARLDGVSWDGGSFLDADVIGSQFGLPIDMSASGCGSGAGYDPSSCHSGAVDREQRVLPLPAASPCPCDPMPCPCAPITCPCGASPGHHISPHKPVRHPIRHSGHAAHIPIPVVSRAHGAPAPVIRTLPTTGVNLAGITGSAFGLLGTGAGALVGAARLTNRRRRRGPA